MTPGQEENEAVTCAQWGAAEGRHLAPTAFCAGGRELLPPTSPYRCVGAWGQCKHLQVVAKAGRAGQAGLGGVIKPAGTVGVLWAEKLQPALSLQTSPPKEL